MAADSTPSTVLVSGTAGTGTNRVEKILGGCVIQENFAGGGAQPTIALVAEHFERVDQRIDQPHCRDLRASIDGKLSMAINPRC